MATAKKKSDSSWNDQYKSPKWQKKRLEILERDEFTCLNCGSKDDQLHVHHIDYIYGNKVWEYNNCNFLTLCEKCHKKAHKLKDSFKEILHQCFGELRYEKSLEDLELFQSALILFFVSNEDSPKYELIRSSLRCLKSHEQEIQDAYGEE